MKLNKKNLCYDYLEYLRQKYPIPGHKCHLELLNSHTINNYDPNIPVEANGACYMEAFGKNTTLIVIPLRYKHFRQLATVLAHEYKHAHIRYADRRELGYSEEEDAAESFALKEIKHYQVSGRWSPREAAEIVSKKYLG